MSGGSILSSDIVIISQISPTPQKAINPAVQDAVFMSEDTETPIYVSQLETLTLFSSFPPKVGCASMRTYNNHHEDIQ